MQSISFLIPGLKGKVEELNNTSKEYEKKILSFLWICRTLEHHEQSKCLNYRHRYGRGIPSQWYIFTKIIYENFLQLWKDINIQNIKYTRPGKKLPNGIFETLTIQKINKKSIRLNLRIDVVYWLLMIFNGSHMVCLCSTF